MERHIINTHRSAPPPPQEHEGSNGHTAVVTEARVWCAVACSGGSPCRWLNSLEAVLQSAAGNASSGHGTVTSARRLPWSWRRPSTTPRSGWRRREREWSTRSTSAYGHKPPLQGTWPGVLLDPELQVRPATVGYVAAAGAPLLTVPSLGGGDAMDDTSVHFLLEMALLSQEEVEQLRKTEKRKLAREEKERKDKELQEVFVRRTAEYLQGLSQPSSSSSPRKRKRKKKKLPKSRLLPRWSSSSWRRGSSPWSSRVRASVSRHNVEEYVLLCVKWLAALVFFLCSDMFIAGFARDVAPRVVFSLLVVRPKMLGIAASMNLKDCAWRDAALFVVSGSGMRTVGFPGSLRAVFPVVADRPRCSASWSVWTRRTRMLVAGLMVTIPRALCFFVVVRPRCSSSWPVMHQKVSHALFGPGSGMRRARFAGIYTSHCVPPLVFRP